MGKKTFEVIYDKKLRRGMLPSIHVFAGREMIEADHIGQAYLEAQHHLETHGWMSEWFDDWRIKTIVQLSKSEKEEKQ